MREKAKNKKLVISFFLLIILCVLVLSKETGMLRRMEPTPTPTPELPLQLQNVWLVQAQGEELTVLHDGASHRYKLSAPVQTMLQECIVDLVVEHGVVTKLSVTRDMVEAKVLRIGADYVELEGYGKVPLEEGSRVYRTYGEVEELSWRDVLVGYTTSAFVLSGEKICAALIREPVEVTNIRVLLQSSSYAGAYHEVLECGSSSRFYISDGSERTQWKDGGERETITPELVESYGGRIYLGTEGNTGKISLYNVKRAVGVPSYRGSLEVTISEGKLLVVNELPMEEYLYGVLPSEMPESFGKEALKAQAVCARSYACNQLMANRYAAYGAHVDDSMTCQVYQNYGETEAATEAVKATFGKILSRDGGCITAYYFSCSYGHTSDSADVWGENAGTLLTGVLQAQGTQNVELREEEKFQEFLGSDREWYDEDSVWFRWNTVLGRELDEKILMRLAERQKAVPEQILLCIGETEEGMRFAKRPVEVFGTLEDIIVVERSDSGLITKLLLVGSEATYLLQREYNIRYVLAPINTVYLRDGSTTSNMNLLPSAYFSVQRENGFFLIQGGGYGHGVGMSQYGARYLAGIGKSYEEILLHFYRDTELVYLYQ